jgi:hypothetical protein
LFQPLFLFLTPVNTTLQAGGTACHSPAWRNSGMIGKLPMTAWMGLALLTATRPPPAAPVSTDALAASLRSLMLQFIPSPLYEDHSKWGQQKEVAKVKWRGKGLEAHPEKVMVLKNDGKWKKVTVEAPLLDKTLVLLVRDLKQAGANTSTFTIDLAFDTAVEFEQQNWHEGLRTWSGSVRGRLRIHLTLDCELQTRLDTSDLLPELVFRLRVVHSDIRYGNLVITHVPGIGGDLAKALGDALHEVVKALKPSLERKLLEKANAAIVKAADTKEIRLSFEKLLGGK